MNRWRTPPNLEGGLQCRPLSFPVALWPHVNGAIEELLNPFHWEQSDGGATIADVVSALYDSVTQFPGECPVIAEQSNIALHWKQAMLIYPLGGTEIWTGETLQEGGGYWRTSPAANGDEYSWGVELASGAYQMGLHAIKSTNSGIFAFRVDDTTNISTVDLYAASPVYNVVTWSDPFTISQSGLHTVILHCTGKNASSGGYRLNFTRLYVVKT